MFFKQSGVGLNGGRCELDFKAGYWDSDEYVASPALWELRRLLDTLGHSGQRPVRDWLRNQMPVLESMLEGTGLCIEEELISSRRSLISRGGPPEAWPVRARDEYLVSGKGLLLILGVSLRYKKGELKRVCEATLEVLLETLVPDDFFDDVGIKFIFENPAAMMGSTCNHAVDETGTCEHIRLAYGAILAARRAPVARRIAAMLSKIFQAPLQCDSLGAWLGDIIAALGCAISEQLVATSSNSGLDATPVQGPKRRRRMDEDLRMAMCDVRLGFGRRLAKARTCRDPPLEEQIPGRL